MKAIVQSKYGSPDVLELREVDKPVPKENEVLVKVYAAATNPADWHIIRGTPYFARLSFGLFKPKHPVRGIDIAGQVEEVGKNVTGFQPGDEVFGGCGWSGGFAEYVCVSEKSLVLKPENITFEEGASINVAAITALQGLRNFGHIQKGQRVLINGASGGVGTFAVQIAKYFGAEVTGVCSTRNLELVHSIGADHVIDYTQVDFTRTGKRYDMIFDAVGNRSVGAYKRALDKNGKCVIAGFSTLSRLIEHASLGPLSSIGSNRKVGMMDTAQTKKEDLEILKDLLGSGQIKPVIDKRYPLSETSEAIAYLEKGHARGKVVITMNNNEEN